MFQNIKSLCTADRLDIRKARSNILSEGLSLEMLDLAFHISSTPTFYTCILN